MTTLTGVRPEKVHLFNESAEPPLGAALNRAFEGAHH